TPLRLFWSSLCSVGAKTCGGGGTSGAARRHFVDGIKGLRYLRSILAQLIWMEAERSQRAPPRRFTGDTEEGH
ncbi:unnamed protein product, partial [Urochloa humidicola]